MMMVAMQRIKQIFSPVAFRRPVKQPAVCYVLKKAPE
jgi:hypothetical protein